MGTKNIDANNFYKDQLKKRMANLPKQDQQACLAVIRGWFKYNGLKLAAATVAR